MKNNKILKPFLLLFLSAVIIFFIFCTKHKPTQWTPKGYLLYAAKGNFYDGVHFYDMLYVINTSEDEIVDTIFTNYSGFPIEFSTLMGISPDGLTLHIGVEYHDTGYADLELENNYTYYEIDTRTKVLKYSGLNSSTIISPNGNYLFHTHGGLKIFDTNTHQVLYHDSSSLYSLAFDQLSPIVYGGLPTWGWVGVFDYYRMQWIRRFQINSATKRSLSFMDMEISPDSKTLYFVAMPANYPGGIFGAYDLKLDSLIAEFRINVHLSSLAVSADRRYVYITDPGIYGIPEYPPTGKINVFDSWNNTLLSPISTDTIDPGELDPYCESPPHHTDGIVITPDGNKAYVADGGSVIFVIDCRTHNIIDTIMTECQNHRIHRLSIQSNP